MSIKGDVDELIDWYQKYRPKAGQNIPVNSGPKTLAREIGFTWPRDTDGKEIVSREMPYRKRTLIAVGEDKR